MTILPGTGIGVDYDYKWKWDDHGKIYLAHVTGKKMTRNFHGKETILSIDKHYNSEIMTNEKTIVFYFFVPIEGENEDLSNDIEKFSAPVPRSDDEKLLLCA